MSLRATEDIVAGFMVILHTQSMFYANLASKGTYVGQIFADLPAFRAAERQDFRQRATPVADLERPRYNP